MATGQARREALFLAALIPSLVAISAAPGDPLLPGKPLLDGQFLVSSDELFKLGFFNPGKSSSRYVGIWYNGISVQTVVWVANRDNPLPDETGMLSLSSYGNLSISDSKGQVFWSTPPARFSAGTAAKLLEGGNFVVSSDGAGDYLWQSFDHPTDTILPGMKLGFDRRTGMNRRLTSWKSDQVPSSGDYTFYMNSLGVPEFLFLRGAERIWRSGPWVGEIFSGVPKTRSYDVLNISYVSNTDQVYYQFSVLDKSLLTRIVVWSEGEIKRMVWIEKEAKWDEFWRGPVDRCDDFGLCGAFAVCVSSVPPVCSCLQGFEPYSPQQWNLGLWKDGCKRKTETDCGNGTDGFLRVERVKLPETSKAIAAETLKMDVCREACSRNCSCTAYSRGWKGCIMWSGALMDLRAYGSGGQDLFVRIARADLGSAPSKGKRRRAVITALVAVAAVVTIALFIGAVGRFLLRKRKTNSPGLLGIYPNVASKISRDTAGSGDLEVPSFDFGAIAAATEHFSADNAVGIGGFGPVYKGKLAGNQLVAVKRLAKNSSQGVDEFMNEVRVIGKLQHRNLVRLLGCCIDGEERILVYEYMPNGSLDSFIFKKEGEQLNWAARSRIIEGIARGLLYLHQDSRLRIIHRDLKASNVLLDDGMNPKISDFGTARIFLGDAFEGTTGRVVGTYGYMSPEYAMDGSFSVKSDVFSFGVLVLEIISGRRNRAIFHSDQALNLLSDAWNLWKEGRGLKLVCSSPGNPIPVTEVLKWIQIGLLCVQERPDDRPEMAAVVAMLVNDNAALPHPKPPGFLMSTKSSGGHGTPTVTVNDITLSSLHARRNFKHAIRIRRINSFFQN